MTLLFLGDDRLSEKRPYIRTTLYMNDDLDMMINSCQQLNGDSTRQAAIESAVKFHYAFLTGEINLDYLCGVYGKKMEAIISSSNKRMNSLLFKQAVELNMITRMLATESRMPKSEYDSIRRKAVEEVKRSRGHIALEDTDGK